MFNFENVGVNGFKISRPHKDNIFFQINPLLKMIANESVTLHNQNMPINRNSLKKPSFKKFLIFNYLLYFSVQIIVNFCANAQISYLIKIIPFCFLSIFAQKTINKSTHYSKCRESQLDHWSDIWMLKRRTKRNLSMKKSMCE